MVTLLNNTFGDVVLPISTVWTSTAGRTQTVASLTLNGNCGLSAFIKSSTSAMTTFLQMFREPMLLIIYKPNMLLLAVELPGLQPTLLPVIPQDSLFRLFASRTLYWIGNGGNWTDPLTGHLAAVAPQPTVHPTHRTALYLMSILLPLPISK